MDAKPDLNGVALRGRGSAALPRLEELSGQPSLDAASAAQVSVLLATAGALSGQRAGAVELVTEDGYRFVPPRDFLFVIPR